MYSTENRLILNYLSRYFLNLPGIYYLYCRFLLVILQVGKLWSMNAQHYLRTKL